VAFVRKRDPRYKSYQEQQKAKKDAQLAENKARAQRERLELQAKAAAYKEQEWARVGEEADSVSEDEDDDEDENGDYDDAFYCVACNKYFKSQRQFENHEQSKKHIKIVQDLREQMLADEEDLDLQAIPLQVDDIEDGEGKSESVEQVNSADVGDDHVPIQSESLDVVTDDEYIPIHPSPKKSKKKAKKKVPNWGFDSEEFSESTTPNLDQPLLEEDLSTLAARLALDQSSRRKKGSRVNTPRQLDSDDENGLSTVKPDGDIGSMNSSNSEATPVKESAKAKREKRKEKKKQKEEAAAAEVI
jgi:DnaJ homolog subfamily A member 5